MFFTLFFIGLRALACLLLFDDFAPRLNFCITYVWVTDVYTIIHNHSHSWLTQVWLVLSPLSSKIRYMTEKQGTTTIEDEKKPKNIRFDLHFYLVIYKSHWMALCFESSYFFIIMMFANMVKVIRNFWVETWFLCDNI